MIVPARDPRASVVIPAHDEGDVIERCLTTLLGGAEPGEWQVLVAANGCSDDTVERAESAGPGVDVLDLPAVGKVGALRAADEVVSVFPRIYLDADIEMTSDVARQLCRELDRPAIRVAAPRMSLDTRGCSWAAKAYYRVWETLPVLGDGYVGSGVYAVDESAHGHLAPWPDVINDDEFVRRSFRPEQRATVAGRFTVRPARTVRAQLRRARRTRAGANQLAGRSDVGGTSTASTGRFVAHELRRPSRWVDLAVFVAVTVAARVAARAGAPSWGRDTSSRGVTGA